jgi:hypothetical protein
MRRRGARQRAFSTGFWPCWPNWTNEGAKTRVLVQAWPVPLGQ